MVIGIIGESCTGKSTLAETLNQSMEVEIYTGKDYLRLAKNEAIALKLFQKKLQEAVLGEHILYVISEKEQLELLPEKSVRVLVTADLTQIKERFAHRMHGNLPAPVAAMLERKHGCFDEIPHDIHVISGETDIEAVCLQVEKMVELLGNPRVENS